MKGKTWVPYSGKLSREKTSRIGEKYDFRGENFHGLLAFAVPKDATLPNFTEKTVTNSHKTAKIRKSLFPRKFPTSKSWDWSQQKYVASQVGDAMLCSLLSAGVSSAGLPGRGAGGVSQYRSGALYQVWYPCQGHLCHQGEMMTVHIRTLLVCMQCGRPSSFPRWISFPFTLTLTWNYLQEHVALWSGKRFVVYAISQEKTIVRVAGKRRHSWRCTESKRE